MRGGALGTADFVVGAAHRADRRSALLADDGSTVPTRLRAHGDSRHAQPCRSAKREVVVLLPDDARVRARQRARDGVPLADPRSAERLAALRARRRRHRRRGARDVRDARRRRSRRRATPCKALLRFTTALGRARAHGARRQCRAAAWNPSIERISYTFSPRYNAYSFAPRFASLQTAGRSARRRRARRESPPNGAACASSRSSVVGHRIRRRSRRATAAASPTTTRCRLRARKPSPKYLQAPRFPMRASTIEGRGADEPIDTGTDGRKPRAQPARRDPGRGRAHARRCGLAHRLRERPNRRPSRRRVHRRRRRQCRGALASARPAGIAAALEPEIEVGSARAAAGDPAAERRLCAARADGARERGALARATGPAGRERPARQRAQLRRHGAERCEDGGVEPLARRRSRRRRQPARRDRRRRDGRRSCGARAHRALRRRRACAPSSSPRSRGSRPTAARSRVIALRVFDASGQPARPGTLGAYRVDPPYRTWWEVETLHDNPLLVESRREPTFAVEEDGLVAHCCSSRRRKRAPPSCDCASTNARSRRSASGSSPSSATGFSSG